MLDRYEQIVGPGEIFNLRKIAEALKGARVVHVNSTREGGGVAEILRRLVPLQRELGLEVNWEVIAGGEDFYRCTKSFHNALQGSRVQIPESLLGAYEETNRHNAETLHEKLASADFVLIHDPQPAPLLRYLNDRKGKWVWRCHIDVSHPFRPVWKYLREFVKGYDASVWSLPAFAQPLSHPSYIIAPSIDPLSEKNIDIDPCEVELILKAFDLDINRPIIAQISRFDRFKDPIGVIEAYRMTKKHTPLQLVLAGGGATDDPEGAKILDEVRIAADNDPDIHVLLLPPDAHHTINALQRGADIVLQKSTREGFGLTVTEAMWKSKPVIGGDTGGIKLQIFNHHTGFLVSTPEGAALRIRYLLKRPEVMKEMGRTAKRFVLEHFLLTRELREHLTLMLAVAHGDVDRIELP